MAELCARVDQGALCCHDVLPPFFIASSERVSSDSPFATTYKSPSVLPRDPDLLPQFPYRKLHQVLLASSQDVWSLLYISFLCSWKGRAMPEIRVILRRGGGRSTREASRDYLDLEERRSSYAHSLSRVHGPHTNLSKVPFALCYHALSSSLLHTFPRGCIGSPMKQASAQDLTVQFPSEFTQIPVPFPQVSCAVGYCIISCFPLGTTQWCR
jgi:hypothetical protein